MPIKKNYSLRNRLIIAILGASALLWLTSLAVMVGVAWHQTGTMFDHTLREAGHLIIAATTDLHRRGVIPPLRTKKEKSDRFEQDIHDPHDDAHLVHYQIVINDTVQVRTDGAPAVPFVTRYGKLNHGFANVFVANEYWRVFVAYNHDGKFAVQVAQTRSSRQAVLYDLANRLVLPALALLTLLGAISWFAIRKLLHPLEETAHTLSQKSPADLTPLSSETLPQELQPIVNALNRVLARLDHALQAERRFTADAAHELRTPLSALRMQTQVLQRQYPALRTSLQKLIHDIDRSTTLIEHLLTLARLDSLDPAAESQALHVEPLDLPVFLQVLIDDYQELAVHHGITLKLNCTCSSLYADAQLLQIAVGNLLNNAIRYSPSHTVVDLSATPHQQGVRLCVCDQGPGVPETERAHLTRRFFRILGSGKAGSGLGLSIVARIAELHHATLEIGSKESGSGLKVTLDFPPTHHTPHTPPAAIVTNLI